MKQLPLVVTALLALTALTASSGCPTSDTTDPFSPPAERIDCEEHSECSAGYFCKAGLCSPGECVAELEPQCNTAETPEDIERLCCRPWQFCNSFNKCEGKADAAVGNQCLVDDDCFGLGEFCSGGNCFATSGRDACTNSYQCPSDERCDRTVFLCVPDNGGCTFAAQYPELACESEQLCDLETGFCIDPGGQECTPETVETDCRANQKCDAIGRCVQCITDDDCGPGTACNAGTGSCYSDINGCTDDADCTDGRRCSPATSECMRPECEENGDCDDSREQCDLNSFSCYLPPASCPSESDEPNDTVGAATTIPLTGYAGTLCRGNTDFLSFPIGPAKRYRATVSFPEYDQAGITVTMLATNGLQTSAPAVFGTSNNKVEVSGISGPTEDGFFSLRIVGSGTVEDIWSYTVSIEETTAPQQVSCDDETTGGIEPNDSFDTAYAIAIPAEQEATTMAFARCGAGDVDFYKIAVPVLHGLEVTVEMENDDGDLDITLYDELNGSSISSSTTSADVERVKAPEGKLEFWLRVAKYSGDSDALASQTYTVTAKKVARPTTCDPDINEPDGSIETAGPLAVDTSVEAIRCNEVDADFFAVAVPANRGGNLRIDFTHGGGDLRLDLLDAAGTVLESSNSSTTSNSFEVVPLPFSASAATWYARVRLNSGSNTTPQTYTISTSTFDASACTLSEPSSNDTFATGTCVGTPVGVSDCDDPLVPPSDWPDLAECTAAAAYTPGCASICGVGDPDYFRVGKLNNGQLLRAKLTHEADDGAMSLSLVKLNPGGSVVEVVPVLNDGDDDVLEANLVAPTVAEAFVREYGVLVKPTGQGDYSAQPYAIEIEVGAACEPDPNEPNGAPDGAKRLRVNPVAGAYSTTVSDATLCGNDDDVFEIFVFQGETLTATMTNLNGVDIDIGTRVFGDGDAPAETVPCGQGMPQGQTAECPDAGNVEPDDDEYTSPMVATYTAPVSDYYYVTVTRRPNGGIGAYTLAVDIAP